MAFGGSRASPAARAEMRGAAAFRVMRGMATRAVTTTSVPGARGSNPVVAASRPLGRHRLHPHVGVFSAWTRGVAASAASFGEFGAPPRIVSGGGSRGKGKGGVVWVPSTAGVGGSARGRAFETTAGAGAGAGAPAPPPQQQRQFAQQQQHTQQQQHAQQQQHHQQQQQHHQHHQQHQQQQPTQQQQQPRIQPPPLSQQRQQRRSTQNQSGDRGAASTASGPRVYCDFAVYKSKAACKFGVIKPTFEPIAGSRDGSRQKKRDGGVLLEFAPAVGQRQYDWQNKQSILLSPLELVELTESLAVLGKGVNFFHDPGMGTARQGAMTKSLKAEPMPDGSGGVFFNLSTSSGAKLNVAVSFAEFCVLRNLVQYLVPRLTGFDEVFKDP
jgi:hypothetical protein